MTRSGQSLVELAVALPAVLALSLGSAAVIRLADAKSGLDGATAAAVADAARQVSPAAAAQCAQQRFTGIVGAYPLVTPRLELSGAFDRGSIYRGQSWATVDLAFVPLWFLPGTVQVQSSAQAMVEPWRSRAQQKCSS